MHSELYLKIADGRTDLVFEVPDSALQVSAVTSLLEWCAYYGDVSGLRHLMTRGFTLESLGENYGLEKAAFHGHWRLCQFLLEYDADPNFQNQETGETPLHAALTKANRPNYDLVVEVLVANGADPNIPTFANRETGAFMRDSRTKGETALHRAAAFGSQKSVSLLINSGARRDAKDLNGDSPLSWASWHLRPDSILRLLCYGDHRIHPDRNSTYDHGAGWGIMGMGKPHFNDKHNA